MDIHEGEDCETDLCGNKVTPRGGNRNTRNTSKHSQKRDLYGNPVAVANGKHGGGRGGLYPSSSMEELVSDEVSQVGQCFDGIRLQFGKLFEKASETLASAKSKAVNVGSSTSITTATTSASTAQVNAGLHRLGLPQSSQVSTSSARQSQASSMHSAFEIASASPARQRGRDPRGRELRARHGA